MRETEALIKKATDAGRREARAAEKDVHTRAAEERLRFALGTRVRIVRKGKGGRIEIDFAIGRRTAAALRTAHGRLVLKLKREVADCGMPNRTSTESEIRVAGSQQLSEQEMKCDD